MDVDSGGDPAKAKGTENTLEAVVKYYNSEVKRIHVYIQREALTQSQGFTCTYTMCCEISPCRMADTVHSPSQLSQKNMTTLWY